MSIKHEYSPDIRRALRAPVVLVMLTAIGGLAPLRAQSATPPQTPPAPAQPAKWKALSGSAVAIGANARGLVWILQDDATRRNRNIYRLRGTIWQQVAAPAGSTAVPVRIAVDPAGSAWLLQSNGAIYYYTGTTWQPVPGDAMDIGIGADGAVWIVGRDQSISRGVGTPPSNYQWTRVSGAANHIAVDPQGNPWVVNSAGQIWYYSANAWIPIPGSASGIAVGPDGVVYLLGRTLSPGGYSVLRSQGSAWVNDGITGASIAAGPPGVIYVGRDVTAQSALEERIPSASWAGSPPPLPQATQTITLNQPTVGIPIGTLTPPAAPPNAPLYVTGLGYNPTPGSVKLISAYQYVYTPGTLVCSDPQSMGACGTVDAGFVGGYTYNTQCDSGFYDLIYGGTCWKCPDGDSHGPWIRSATSVDTNDACWRNVTSPAVWDKYGFVWDCTGPGQFYDGFDFNKQLHESCWHCPSDYPTRSGDPVWSSTACYSHQTGPAAFLKYNGCPAPDRTAMYPNDQRRPGKPFLDIASGISVANNAGGACWACPVADENGNYLYTERNANTLIGRKTGNNACKVGFRYTPGKFLEPGLAGLAGAKDALVQEQVFQRPSALTKYLFAMATKRQMSGTKASQWVADQWRDIAAHPYQNENVRALVFQYMLGHAPDYMYASGTPASGAAEQKLVISFQQYIQARRTYVAQEALDMYYVWRKNVDVTRTLHAESELMTLFYYGTVPLDFTSMVAAVMVPTTTGIAVLTAAWAGEAFQASVAASRVGNTTVFAVTRAMTLYNAFSSFEAFEALPLLAEIDVVSGPVGIALAGATMSAIAIQQVVQIATAEQNLKGARDNTMKATVDLLALYKSDNGPDQALMYWALATGITAEQEDSQLLQAAQSAYAAAQKANFQ